MNATNDEIGVSHRMALLGAFEERERLCCNIACGALLMAELVLREVDPQRIAGYGELSPQCAARIVAAERILIDLLHRIRRDLDHE